jgi:hypothetical protein
VASARAQTPFGGDDTGLIPPPKSPIAKCEAGAAKAEGKLIACILKCHASRASGKLADDTAEDACEKTLAGTSCVAKFTLAISKLSGCPACINGTTMANLAGTTESLLDGNNAAIYCGTTTIPCGAIVGGFCWFKAANGANCDTTCAAAGRVYSDATRDYAGSNGTDANCGAVAAALGPVLVGPTAATSDGGYGCIDIDANGNGAILRITSPVTDSTSAHNPGYRFCACQ